MFSHRATPPLGSAYTLRTRTLDIVARQALHWGHLLGWRRQAFWLFGAPGGEAGERSRRARLLESDRIKNAR